MKQTIGSEPASAIFSNVGVRSEGLTKREIFTNSAPTEIPEWFPYKPVTKEIKPRPDWTTIENEEDSQICKSWIHDPCFDLPEHLKWFQDGFDKYFDESSALELQNKIQKYFQWRTFYADNLIKELNK